MNRDAILKPGINCWRIESADRVSFLVDGADYFHAFRETAKRAEHSILILGWDIDSRFELEREPPGDGLPTRLGDFLNRLVSRRERLQVHILNWDFAVIFAAAREWLPLYKLDWTTHPRLHFRMDSHHPAGASHHQKIVVVDDCIAFVGGLDFALGRWDTSEHRADDPRRRDLDAAIPQPYHDAQMMVSGNIAQALGELARQRWRTATGQILNVPSASGHYDPWPDTVAVDLREAPVAIARTYPEYQDQPAVGEIAHLLLDALHAARKTIYIENQYLTVHAIGEALVRRLTKAEGPEIVVILPQRSVGWLSQNTMDVLRERLLKRLNAADAYDRLRVYYPDVPHLGEQCVNVHAKILIIDDELLRVGSANFNNRSMSLDTECDLAIEAQGKASIRNAIRSFRNRLLAEHLDVAVPAVEAALAAQADSLIRAMATLTGQERTLKPLAFTVSEELDALVPDAQISDPEQPIDGEYLAQQLVTDEDQGPARRTLISLASVLIVALLLAASWRWTPLSEWVDVRETLDGFSRLRGDWVAPLAVIALYVVAGLLAFPVTLLIIATGVVFGAAYGFAYALLGTGVSAVVTYLIGQRLGHNAVRRLSNRWVARVSRRLSQQGLLAIITLRVVPVAPFTVINLVAGASHIRFRDFAWGTLLGMAPGALALTLFSDQVVAAIATPETLRIAGLLVLAVVIGVSAWGLSRWLLRRRQDRIERQEGQRSR